MEDCPNGSPVALSMNVTLILFEPKSRSIKFIDAGCEKDTNFGESVEIPEKKVRYKADQVYFSYRTPVGVVLTFRKIY